MTDVSPELEQQVLEAAARGDRFAFGIAARSADLDLDEARALVRSKGIVRMVDRVVKRSSVIPSEFEPSLREADEARADGDDGGGPVLYGHFAVFNRWTEIDSWFEGHFLESIAPRAFRKTFRENRSQIKVLFQHGYDFSIGDKPLGPIDDLREDDVGGYYEVPLLDAAYVREDLLPGLREGLYGASFRFKTIREEFNEEPDPSEHNPTGLPERTLKEVRLFEFGPVTFPAYEEATAAVRAASPAAPDADTDAAPATPDAGSSTSGQARRKPGRDYLRHGREEPAWRL